jgi:hypothetical protein
VSSKASCILHIPCTIHFPRGCILLLIQIAFHQGAASAASAAAERPPDEPTTLDIDVMTYRYWEARVINSLTVLNASEVARRTVKPGSSNQVSLVTLAEPCEDQHLEGHRVVFVQWSGEGAQQGRCVHTDYETDLVYPMPNVHPLRTLSDAIVIHPAIGTNIRKDKVFSNPTWL